MNNLDIQVTLSSRFKTSFEADKITVEMWQLLGLETKAQFARLAIGRSLALGKLPEIEIDSRGIEVPAQALFSTDNIGAWVGILVAHSITSGSNLINSQESLRSAIKSHWHRGAMELWKDWESADFNYDKFVELLITRRSEMPEESDASDSENEKTLPSLPPTDDSTLLVKALDQLQIKVQVKETISGTRVTRYKVLLVNLNDLAKLNKNMGQLALAMNLGSNHPSISNGDQPMTVFIDVPRPKNTWSTVGFNKLENWVKESETNTNKLSLYVGVSVTGESDVAFDLAQAPHLFVAGATGSGKSVCLHSLILSLILKHKSDTLNLALIDPKKVEFSAYAKLSYLYKNKIVTEVDEAKEYLTDLVNEMETRYTLFESINVKNITEARIKGQKLPYIVVFIEEMADLVLTDKKGIEPLIIKLAQKSRAAGIHLVLATQRPDSETFDGLIRSNVPARIALFVQKSTESKIILDEIGAESLLKNGDLLLKIPGEQIQRAHAPFIRDENITKTISAVNR
jgi:DNA segregation ATPase FtsK/SpoIIIE, S-DNA-T family